MKKILMRITTLLLLCCIQCPQVHSQEESKTNSAFSEISCYGNASEYKGLTLSSTGFGGSDSSSWARFDNIDFGNTETYEVECQVAVAEENAGGILTVTLDSMSNSPLAEIKIESTGGWTTYKWQKVVVNNSEITGIHSIYFTFSTSGVCDFKAFRFTELTGEGGSKFPSDIAGTKYEKGFDILSTLGILPYANENEFNIKEKVTYKEFFSNALKMQNEQSESAVLEKITEFGGIDSKNITFNDVAKLLVNMLGYDYKTYKYPDSNNAYFSIANEMKIFNTTLATPKEEITRGDMILILYEASKTDIATPTQFGAKTSYGINKNNTLLSEYLNIHCSKGIVEQNAITGLMYPSKINDNYVSINNYLFKEDKTNASSLLGYSVLYYYHYNSSLDENTLLYVKSDDNKNETTSVTAKDIIDFSNRVFSYKNEKDNTIRKTIGYDTAIIYNGLAISKYTDSLFSPKNGSVKMLDNNNDNVIDVVFITDTNDYSLKTYSNDTLYMNDDSVTIKLKSDTESIKSNIIDKHGRAVDLRTLTENDILTVSKAVDMNGNFIFYEIVVCKKVLRDVASGYDDFNEKITLGNTEFEITKKCLDKFKNINDSTVLAKDKFQIGDDVVAYFNCYGVVVKLEKEVGTKNIGYFVTMKMEGKLAQQLQIKVFCEDGELRIFECADKITIDSVRTNEGVAQTSIQTDTIAYYKLNSFNEINFVSFPKSAKEDSREGIYLIADGSFAYKSATGSLSGKSILDNLATIFKVPTDLTDEDSFKIISRSDFSDDDIVTLKCYAETADSMQTKFAVCRYNSVSPELNESSQICYVTKINKAITPYGENLYKIYYYDRGEEKSDYVSERMSSVSESLSVGDGIRFIKNQKGEISGMKKMIDSQNGTTSGGSTAFNAQTRFAVGSVYRREKNLIQLGADTEIFNSSGAYVYICEDGKLSIGNITDIIDKKTAGDNADNIMMYIYHTQVRSILIKR